MKSNGVVAVLWWRISFFSSLFSGMHKLPMEEKEYDEIRLGKDNSERIFFNRNGNKAYCNAIKFKLYNRGGAKKRDSFPFIGGAL